MVDPSTGQASRWSDAGGFLEVTQDAQQYIRSTSSIGVDSAIAVPCFVNGRRKAILISHFGVSTPRNAGEVGLDVENAGVNVTDEVSKMRLRLADGIRADFRHELIHLLRSIGALDGPLWRRLVDHANSLRFLELDAEATVYVPFRTL